MKFKKLRKSFRIFFPIKYSEIELLLLKLNNNQIKSLIKKDNVYEISFFDGIKFFVRDSSYSDIQVFQQVFNFQEYKIVYKLLSLNEQFNKDIIIIDAGANVGYTTIYFSKYFETSTIFAIEPSQENSELYLQNIKTLKNYNKIKLYQNALCHQTGLNFSIDRNFRDGKDWSIATNVNVNGIIKGITIQEIISENALKYISLLKIDIEGAERFIFKSENDLSFLKITQIIAIEIHDEFEIRESIYKILKNYNFLLLESGELTIGINKSFC